MGTFPEIVENQSFISSLSVKTACHIAYNLHLNLWKLKFMVLDLLCFIPPIGF